MSNPADDKNERSFAEEASSNARAGLVGEFIGYMREYTKWWLTPIIVVFLVIAAFLIFGTTTGSLPFIYTLF